MSATMAERPRLIFDCSDVIRRAVRLYAAKHDLSTSDTISKAIETLCKAEVDEAREILTREAKKKRD